MAYERSKLFTLPLCEGEGRFSPDLKGLCEWLETMPPQQEYCYLDNGYCLVAQFFTALGVRGIGVIPGSYRCGNSREYHSYPEVFDDVALAHPRTFGAALSRARRALRECAR